MLHKLDNKQNNKDYWKGIRQKRRQQKKQHCLQQCQALAICISSINYIGKAISTFIAQDCSKLYHMYLLDSTGFVIYFSFALLPHSLLNIALSFDHSVIEPTYISTLKCLIYFMALLLYVMERVNDISYLPKNAAFLSFAIWIRIDSNIIVPYSINLNKMARWWLSI